MLPSCYRSSTASCQSQQGRPRQRPDRIVADRGYDHDSYRRELWRRGWRWVVERTFAWLHNYRRLRIRWERDPDIHMAFLTLACALICRRYLREFETGSKSGQNLAESFEALSGSFL